jgi:hypothetical protein
LVEGAAAGLVRIREAGFQPRICSSPIDGHPTCREEKWAWVGKHLAPHWAATSRTRP